LPLLLLLLLQVRGGFQQALELVAGEADSADGALPEPSAAAEAIEAALFKLHGKHAWLLLVLLLPVLCSSADANACRGAIRPEQAVLFSALMRLLPCPTSAPNARPSAFLQATPPRNTRPASVPCSTTSR
jgi:hypothetical protein